MQFFIYIYNRLMTSFDVIEIERLSKNNNAIIPFNIFLQPELQKSVDVILQIDIVSQILI